jgi:hypothetical protein
MVITQCGNKFQVFHMPDRVDADVLASALRELLHAGPETRWVLDFSATVHVHYGALRRFSARLRRVRPASSPVLLAGLNPYCLEIFRFSLRAEDWDLLAIAENEWASAQIGGNDLDEGPQFDRGQVWIVWGEAPALFFPPCPN